MIEFSTILQKHQAMVVNLEQMALQIEQIARRMSAADNQYLAAELVGSVSWERSTLPFIALTTDTSILTAIANDYGFDTVFARQVEALCTADDVVVTPFPPGETPADV